MIDHLALQVADVAAAAAFYTRVFAPAGVREAMRYDAPGGPLVGLCGPDGHPQLWLGPLAEGGDRPVHLAIRAPSRAAVDEVFALAREEGVELLHEPRVWPEYHPGYYGAFFRDPDGNNVEAVHHTPPDDSSGSIAASASERGADRSAESGQATPPDDSSGSIAASAGERGRGSGATPPSVPPQD